MLTITLSHLDMNKRYYKPFLHLIWGLLFLVTIYTPAIAQETYTDADGNVYQTVTIGDRVWLTQT